MNERIGNNKIYLLAKEAGLIEFEKFDWNPELGSPTYESVAKARKFAELIIAKCIEEAGEPADGLIKGDTWHDGVRASVWSIKQYFGVK